MKHHPIHVTTAKMTGHRKNNGRKKTKKTKKQTCTVKHNNYMSSAWLHMRTVQRNNTPKGDPTKMTCGAVRSIAEAPPHDFVGKGVEVMPRYWAKMQHVVYLIPWPWDYT